MRLAFLLLAAGCAGTIDTTGPDGFRTLASAAWAVVELDGDRYHWILGSDDVGLCGKLQDAYEGVGEGWTTWENSGQGEGDCNDLWVTAAEAWEPFSGGEPRLLRLEMTQGGLLDSLEDITEPHTGTYDVSEGELIIAVQEFVSNPLQDLADSTPGCTWDGADDAWSQWTADSGTATFEADGDDRWTVDVDATLELEDEGGSGSVEASVAASRCDLPMGDLNWIEAAIFLPILAPWALD